MRLKEDHYKCCFSKRTLADIDVNSVLAECDVLHGLVETFSLLDTLLWAIVWPAGIEKMNKTLSNNFVMEEELQVREKNADGGEKVKNLTKMLSYKSDGKDGKTLGGTLKAFTRDTNIEGVNNAGRSEGRVRRLEQG